MTAAGSSSRSRIGKVSLPEFPERFIHDLCVFGTKVDAVFLESSDNALDSDLEQSDRRCELATKQERCLRSTVSVLQRFRRALKDGLDVIVDGRVHEVSLTGHGANLDNAPTATTEAATSVVGDIVRDGSDISPGPLTPVEESPATGAAAPSQRPHPNPFTESGSDQR